MGESESFFLPFFYFVHIIAGRGGGGGSGGDDGMSPKQIKKLSLAAEFYVAITLKCFFTQIFTQILLASIVEGKEIYFL